MDFLLIYCAFFFYHQTIDAAFSVPEKPLKLPDLGGTGSCGQNVFLALKLNKKCDKGVRICYPSMLIAAATNNYKPSRRFQLASEGEKTICNNPGHNAFEISIDKMDKKGLVMINLKGPNGPSFSFKFNPSETLIIQLRGSRNLISMPKKCQNFMECDRASELSSHWSGDARNGEGPTYLEDYSGPWQLGLDMLPLDNAKTSITYKNLCQNDNETWDVTIGNNDPSLSTSTETAPTRPKITPATAEVAKLIWQNLNLSYDPCENFYAFACGAEKEQSDGIPLSPDIWTLHNELIEPKKSDSMTERKLKEAYKICVDERTKNNGKLMNATKQIYKQLKKEFGGMPAVKGQKWKSKFINTTTEFLSPDSRKFWKMIGHFASQHGVACFMDSHYEVAYEPTSARNVIMFTQPRGTYPHQRIMVEKRLVEMLEKDQQFIFSLTEKFGLTINKSKMDEKYAKRVLSAMMALKMKMAMAMAPQEMYHDVRHYLTYKIDELGRDYPSIHWEGLLEGMGILKSLKESEKQYNYSVIIGHPSYVAFLNTLFQGKQWAYSPEIFNYIGLQILLAHYDFLDPPQGPPNANRTIQNCLRDLENLFPNGIGYAYVKTIQNRDAIFADVTSKTDLIFKAFKEMLNSIEWMLPKSKEKAKEKLSKMAKKIGWPKKLYGDFKNTANLDRKQKYYVNLELKTPWFATYSQLLSTLRSTAYEWFKKPVSNNSDFTDKVSPFTRNAFYEPTSNSLIVTLRYLTLPFYKLGFPEWYNYASLGSVIGHELSHGFDSNGVQYGTRGETNCNWAKCGWMDPNSTKAFNEMSQCVVRQYAGQCCPLDKGPVRCVDGELTLGENQADIAGAQAAYKAYQMWLKNDGKKGKKDPQFPELAQFDDNQLFWIAFSQYWCNSRKFDVRDLLTDVHSPGHCRVNQVLQNIPDFGEDFKCMRGNSKMYPKAEDRCKVWTGK